MKLKGKKICPLCGSKKVTLIQQNNINSIANLYKAHFGYDIKAMHPPKLINFNHCENCDLEYFWPSFVADSDFYSYFEKYNWYYLKEKPEFEIASNYIRKTDLVLEIGSGEGNFAKHIKSKSYTGLELNSEAVVVAKKNGLNVKREDLFNYARTSKKYDVVCMFQLLEHIDNVGIFLKKAISLLKKDGLLIISVPSNESLMGMAVNHTLNLPPHHQTRWSDECLQNIASIFDLKVVRINHETLSDYHRNTYLKEKLLTNLGMNNGRSTDNTFSFKLISTFVQLITLLPSKILNGKNIVGQSVTVVYKKNNYE